MFYHEIYEFSPKRVPRLPLELLKYTKERPAYFLLHRQTIAKFTVSGIVHSVHDLSVLISEGKRNF